MGKKFKMLIFSGLFVSTVALSSYVVLSNRDFMGLGSTVSVSAVPSKVYDFSKESYDRAYSEQLYLKGEVSKYENFLAYWVSTYVGFLGDDGQNTFSLSSVELLDKGSFRSVEDLVSKYPLLNGVVSTVRVSYFFDEGLNRLVQSVTVVRDAIGDERTVYVTYDKDLSLVDSWVATSPLEVSNK